jgi:hypothetical protein
MGILVLYWSMPCIVQIIIIKLEWLEWKKVIIVMKLLFIISLGFGIYEFVENGRPKQQLTEIQSNTALNNLTQYPP